MGFPLAADARAQTDPRRQERYRVDWYKQYADYYLDPPMLDAGEDAEVLHLRAKGYAARTESGGFIPSGALPLITPKRSRQRAEKLVKVGLWKAVDGGFLIVDWEEEQSELEALTARRRSDRERKRAQRDRDRERGQSADKSRDSHVTVGLDAGASESRRTVKKEQSQAGYSQVYPLVTSELETDNSTDTLAEHHVSAPHTQKPSRDNFEGKREEKRRRTTNYSPSPADAGDDATPQHRKHKQPPPRFDDFWHAYPRRVGKIAAQKAYTKALAAGATPDELIAGASFYAMEKKLSDPQYIKHPATWLNSGCWQDEPDPGYKPRVITGPSAAATAMPRPFAEVRADPLAFGHRADHAGELEFDAFPDLDFGRVPE